MSSRDMSNLLDILSERKSVLLGLLSFEKKRRNSGVWEGREEGRGFCFCFCRGSVVGGTWTSVQPYGTLGDAAFRIVVGLGHVCYIGHGASRLLVCISIPLFLMPFGF
jgi:hypothetical protein